MNEKKILAVDYDNTLKQGDRVSGRNRKAAAEFQKAGNILVLDTGRNYMDAVAAAEECGIPFDYICALAGNLLFDGKCRTFIAETHARMHDFPDITETITKIKPLFIRRYYRKDGIFLRLGNDKYEEESEWFSGCSIEKFNDDFLPFSLMTCRFESPAAALQAANELGKLYQNGLIYSHESFIDVLPKNGGKAFGLKKLASRIGVPKENIYAIGDSFADLQMITEFHGYFVDTAPESLIKQSDGSYTDVASLIEDILTLF